jgi:hypothetical protein
VHEGYPWRWQVLTPGAPGPDGRILIPPGPRASTPQRAQRPRPETNPRGHSDS